MIVLCEVLPRSRKWSRQKRKPRDKSFLKMRSRATTVRYPRSQLHSSHKSHPFPLLFVTSTTKTAHYAKEFVQLSRSKSLSRVASYCRRVSSAFWTQWRKYFLLIANVKAKSFKLCGSLKRFLFECLISAGFHSSHARLHSRIEIECLGYRFRLCNDPRLASVFPFA